MTADIQRGLFAFLCPYFTVLVVRRAKYAKAALQYPLELLILYTSLSFLSESANTQSVLNICLRKFKNHKEEL